MTSKILMNNNQEIVLNNQLEISSEAKQDNSFKIGSGKSQQIMFDKSEIKIENHQQMLKPEIGTNEILNVSNESKSPNQNKPKKRGRKSKAELESLKMEETSYTSSTSMTNTNETPNLLGNTSSLEMSSLNVSAEIKPKKRGRKSKAEMESLKMEETFFTSNTSMTHTNETSNLIENASTNITTEIEPKRAERNGTIETESLKMEPKTENIATDDSPLIKMATNAKPKKRRFEVSLEDQNKIFLENSDLGNFTNSLMLLKRTIMLLFKLTKIQLIFG
jgi:hypothetical protein